MVQVLQKSELPLGLRRARLSLGLLHGVLVTLAVLTEKDLCIGPVTQCLLYVVLLVKERFVSGRALKLTLNPT